MDPGLHEATHVPRVQYSASAGLSPRRDIATIVTNSCLEGADGSGEVEKDYRSEPHDAAAKSTHTKNTQLARTYARREIARQLSSPQEIRELKQPPGR